MRTTSVPTLSLRPATLDDAALPDAGHVADGQITVPLGAVVAGAVHRITFKAVIQ